MNPKFLIKQGMTFSFSVQYTDTDGITPLPLTGLTLTSQVRGTAGFEATLDIVVIDESLGTFSVNYPLTTISWPIGLLYWDIRILNGTIYTATLTIPFEVERGVTLI